MKKNILFMLIGMIIMAGIGYGVYAINASEINYTPTWKKANGDSITNVGDAIDELYNKAIDDNADSLRLLRGTHTLNVEQGKKYLIVISVTSYNYESQRYKPSIVSGCNIERTYGQIGNTYDVLAAYANAYIVTATSNVITISGNTVDSNWTFVSYYKIN